MRVQPISSIRPGSDPYDQDQVHMGTSLPGKQHIEIMYDPNVSPADRHDYIIVVNKRTGERMKVMVNS